MARPQPSISSAWAAAFGAALALLLLAASPSWLSQGGGHGVRDAFSLVCHQLADRSPHVNGAQWALCHRCTGILVGLVFGLATGPVVRSAYERAARAVGSGRLLLLLGVPTAIDWLLGATGLWVNTPVSRLLTGALFGLGAGWLLADALLRRPPSVLSTHPTS